MRSIVCKRLISSSTSRAGRRRPAADALLSRTCPYSRHHTKLAAVPIREVFMLQGDVDMHPTWGTVALLSAGSAAISAAITHGVMKVFRGRSSGPAAKRQRVGSASDMQHVKQHSSSACPSPTAAAAAAAAEQQQQPRVSDTAVTTPSPTTPVRHTDAADTEGPRSPGVDVQKLQELEQRVADLNALAELGKVYQESLSLSAALRNLSALTVRNDKVLGRGSLAVVSEGQYAGDSVAVKLLPIGSVFAEDSRREASLALCLQHANIVRVVGVHLVQVEAKPYLALVQETASGGDLGWQVEDCDFHCGEGGACSLCMAVKLLLDAARGLAYMHEAGIVHADVKSRNLLLFEEEGGAEEQAKEEGEGEEGAGGAARQEEAEVAQEGSQAPANSEPGAADAPGSAAGDGALGVAPAGAEATELVVDEPEEEGEGADAAQERVWVLKWCDFGISFVAKDMPGGVCKQAMGTPGFRGPEVAERGWSRESDVFAFGIIAWQLLTGLKPIAYDREWRMHLPHPRLLQFEGGIPGKLQQLVLDCCRDSYSDRPSMEEVVERLEDIAGDLLQQQQAEQAAAAAAEQATATAAAAAAATAAQADAAAAAGDQQQQQQQMVYASKGGLARALAAASMVAEPPHLERLHTLSHQHTLPPALQQQQGLVLAGGGQELAASLQAQGVPAYQVLIENEDDPVTARAVAAALGQHFDLQSAAAAAAAGGEGRAQEEGLGGGGGAAGARTPLRSPSSSRPSSATSSPRMYAPEGGGGRSGGGGGSYTTTSNGNGSAPICIARSMSRRRSHDIPLAPPSPAGARGSLGDDGSDKGSLAAAAPAPAGWYVAPAQSFKQGGLWLGPVRGSSSGPGCLTPTDVELHQDGPLTSLGDGPGVLGDSRGSPGDPFAAAAGGQMGVAVGEQEQGYDNAAAQPPPSAAAAAAGYGGGSGRSSDGGRSLRRASTMKRLGADMLAAANVLSKALSAFSTASQQVPGLVTPSAAGTVTVGCDAGCSAPPQLLLTQDLIRAAHNLSEALAAVLPSAAAMAGEPEDVAAPASNAARAAAAKLRAIPSGTELHLAASEDHLAGGGGGLYPSHGRGWGQQQQQEGVAGGGIFRHHSVPTTAQHRHTVGGHTPAAAAAASVPMRSYRGFSWSAGDAGSSAGEAARRLLSSGSLQPPAFAAGGGGLGVVLGEGGGAAGAGFGGIGAGGRRSYEQQVRVGSWEGAGAANQQQQQQQSSPAGDGGVHLLRMPSRRGRSLDL